jgi:hypothetical protein
MAVNKHKPHQRPPPAISRRVTEMDGIAETRPGANNVLLRADHAPLDGTPARMPLPKWLPTLTRPPEVRRLDCAPGKAARDLGGELGT